MLSYAVYRNVYVLQVYNVRVQFNPISIGLVCICEGGWILFFARYFAKITKGFSLLLSINMVVVCKNKAKKQKIQNCNRESHTYTDNSTVSLFFVVVL